MNDLPLLGDMNLAFGDAPIDSSIRVPVRTHDSTFLWHLPYGFGETRVAAVALLTFTALSG
jgi:hypothetical protein